MPETKQEVIPDKDAGGPVAQLKRNLNVYAQVYAECLRHAWKVLNDSGIVGEDTEACRNRQIEIANTLFGQFWDDQITLKKNAPMEKAMEFAQTFLEEKGQTGPAFGGNYMGGV